MIQCDDCAQRWELFNRPLPDPLLIERVLPQKNLDNRVFGRLNKTITKAVLLLVVGGAGLAYASYNAGKHIGTDDPSYRFAQELGLFTDIKQIHDIDGLQITLDKGLFTCKRISKDEVDENAAYAAL